MSKGEATKMLRFKRERFIPEPQAGTISEIADQNRTKIAERLTGGKLVHVSLIVRHGARGPNKSEMRPFTAPKEGGDGELKSQTGRLVCAISSFTTKSSVIRVYSGRL